MERWLAYQIKNMKSAILFAEFYAFVPRGIKQDDLPYFLKWIKKPEIVHAGKIEEVWENLCTITISLL